MRRSTASPEHLVLGLEGCHPKVCNLDVLRAVEKQVLWLEVTVTDVERVAVVDTEDDLLKVVQRFVFSQSTTGDKVIEELPTLDVLHDEIPAELQSEWHAAGGKGRGTYSSVEVSQTSYRFITFG